MGKKRNSHCNGKTQCKQSKFEQRMQKDMRKKKLYQKTKNPKIDVLLDFLYQRGVPVDDIIRDCCSQDNLIFTLICLILMLTSAAAGTAQAINYGSQVLSHGSTIKGYIPKNIENSILKIAA